MQVGPVAFATGPLSLLLRSLVQELGGERDPARGGFEAEGLEGIKLFR